MALYKQFGNNWSLIAKHCPGKKPQQIRQRVRKLLELGKTNQFSEKEDDLILELYEIYPKDWKKMTSALNLSKMSMGGKTAEKVK